MSLDAVELAHAPARRRHDGRHRPAPARAERAARCRRPRRRRLPPPTRLGLGGLPGRRPVLRALRLSHHDAAPRGVGRRRPDQPRSVLGPPGQAVAPGPVPGRGRTGPVPDPQRRLRWTGCQRAGRSLRPPRRRHLDAALRQQLAPHLRPPVLFRAVLDALAPAAHVVAGHRGAVLLGLAVAARAAPPPGPRRLATGGPARRGHARGALLRPDGRAVQPRGGPLEDLLRDRHPSLRSDGRGHHRLRRGVPTTAEPQVPSDTALGRTGGGRRPRRVLGDLGHAGRTAEELHVRGWLSPLRGSGRPRRGRCPARPTGPLRPPAGRPPVAFPRHHLLRHLPVALAGDRVPDRPAHRAVPVAPRPVAGRGHAGRLDRQLLPGGAPHPPGPPDRLGALDGRTGGRCRHRRHHRGGHVPRRRRPHYRRPHVAPRRADRAERPERARRGRVREPGADPPHHRADRGRPAAASWSWATR